MKDYELRQVQAAKPLYADQEPERCLDKQYTGGGSGQTLGLGRRPIMRRIEDALQQGHFAQQRAEKARRAMEIVGAHPEFAELLDLMDQF